MSLIITIDPPKEIIVQQQVTRSIENIEIERIIDEPKEKRVTALVAGFGHMELETLCGENYNNPPWTDEMIGNAIKAKLGLT